MSYRPMGLPTVPIWDSLTSPRYPLGNLGMIELSHGLVWGTLLNHYKNMDLPLDQCETSLTCPRYMELYMDHLETVMVFPCIKVGYPVWPWTIWEKNGLSHWTNIEHPNLSKVYGYSSKRQYLNCYFQCCL